MKIDTIIFVFLALQLYLIGEKCFNNAIPYRPETRKLFCVPLQVVPHLMNPSTQIKLFLRSAIASLAGPKCS